MGREPVDGSVYLRIDADGWASSYQNNPLLQRVVGEIKQLLAVLHIMNYISLNSVSEVDYLRLDHLI